MVLHYQSRFQEIKLTQKIQKKNVTTQTTNAYTMCGKTMHQGIINVSMFSTSTFNSFVFRVALLKTFQSIFYSFDYFPFGEH